MEGFIDVLSSVWLWLLAGLVWLKRNFLRLLGFLAKTVIVSVIARFFYLCFRTVRIAKTPSQRAYAVMGCHNIMLGQAVAIMESPDTSRALARRILKFVEATTPLVDAYVDRLEAGAA